MTGERGAQRAARLAGPGRLVRRADLSVARRVGRSAASPQACRRRLPRSPGAATTARPVSTAPGAGSLLAVPPGYLAASTRSGCFRADSRRADRARPAAGRHASGADRRHGALHPDGGAAQRVHGLAASRWSRRPTSLFQPLNPQLGPAPGPAALERGDPPAAHVRPHLRAAAPPVTPAGPARAPCRGPRPACSGRCRRSSTRPPLERRARGGACATADQIAQPGRALPPGAGAVRRQPLGHASNTAAGDALYAEALYIMLAVPGALIALGLAYLAALGTVERDRRELGAAARPRRHAPRSARRSRRWRASLIGVVAGLLGAGVALPRRRHLSTGGVGADHRHAGDRRRSLVCVVLAIAGALRRAARRRRRRVCASSVSAEPPRRGRARPAALAAALPRPRSRSRSAG